MNIIHTIVNNTNGPSMDYITFRNDFRQCSRKLAPISLPNIITVQRHSPPRSLKKLPISTLLHQREVPGCKTTR